MRKAVIGPVGKSILQCTSTANVFGSPLRQRFLTVTCSAHTVSGIVMLSVSRVAFATILVAVSSGAHAWNILKNPDFSGGTTGWNITHTGGGTASYESFLGSPAGGSLRMDSDPGTSHADQCVDVQKWLVIDIAVRAFNNVPGGGGTHTNKLDVYDAADCGGNILSTITMPDAGTPVVETPGWYEVSVLGTPLPSGAISAKLSLDTAAPSGSTSYFLLDHAQVVPPDEIFPNAFELN
jgi:hypothetical protein